LARPGRFSVKERDTWGLPFQLVPDFMQDCVRGSTARTRTLMLGVCALLIGCEALWPLVAMAAPSVSWELPADCPSVQEGKAEVARLLRRNLTTIDLDFSSSVRIRRVSATELEASITIRTGRTTRERVLHDQACAVLMHAAAVIVALAIDPSVQVATPTPTRSAPPRVSGPAGSARGSADSTSITNAGDGASAADATASSGATGHAGAGASTDSSAESPPSAASSALDTPSSSPPTAAVSAELPPAVEEPSSSSLPNITHQVAGPTGANATASGASSGLSLYFALGAGLAVGILPGVAPVAEASVGVFGEAWRAALHFDYAPSQRATLGGAAGMGGSISLASAAVDAGLRLWVGTLEIPIALGFEVGSFNASGQGVATRTSETAGWLAAFLGTGMRVALGPVFSLSLRIEAVIALRRPQFALENLAEPGDRPVFYRPEPLGARAFLAIEARLP
jgi:hypothetical protein